MGELDPVARIFHDLDDVLAGVAFQRVAHAAGRAAKAAVLDVAGDTLGPDRAMSRFRTGRVRLGAGYDASGTLVTVNMRPAGVWVLVDQGRRSSGAIYPRTGRGKAKSATRGRALRTPDGPRAASSYGPSRGHAVIRRSAARAADDAPRAAFHQIEAELRRAVR